MSESIEEKKLFGRFTFSLTQEQLEWLRSKGDEGYNMSKIIQKMIDTQMQKDKLKKEVSA